MPLPDPTQASFPPSQGPLFAHLASFINQGCCQLPEDKILIDSQQTDFAALLTGSTTQESVYLFQHALSSQTQVSGDPSDRKHVPNEVGTKKIVADTQLKLFRPEPKSTDLL